MISRDDFDWMMEKLGDLSNDEAVADIVGDAENLRLFARYELGAKIDCRDLPTVQRAAMYKLMADTDAFAHSDASTVIGRILSATENQEK